MVSIIVQVDDCAILEADGGSGLTTVTECHAVVPHV